MWVYQHLKNNHAILPPLNPSTAIHLSSPLPHSPPAPTPIHHRKNPPLSPHLSIYHTTISINLPPSLPSSPSSPPPHKSSPIPIPPNHPPSSILSNHLTPPKKQHHTQSEQDSSPHPRPHPPSAHTPHTPSPATKAAYSTPSSNSDTPHSA